MSRPTSGDEVVDLGGCEGCALGCAVACEGGRQERALEARRVLIGSGIALGILGVGPVLATRQAIVLSLGTVTVVLGLLVALLAGLAVRAGRPRGDRPARWAFRLLPAGVVTMVLAWVGAVLARLL